MSVLGYITNVNNILYFDMYAQQSITVWSFMPISSSKFIFRQSFHLARVPGYLTYPVCLISYIAGVSGYLT